jgi:hypothetical protein
MFSTGLNVVLAKITIISEQSIRFAEPVFQFVQCFEHQFDALLVIGFRGQAGGEIMSMLSISTAAWLL